MVVSDTSPICSLLLIDRVDLLEALFQRIVIPLAVRDELAHPDAPRDWTVEKLLGKHASVPFNPEVANVFFRSVMIEAWGRGIERILGACEAAGTPRPEVGVEPSGVWLVFPFAESYRQAMAGSMSVEAPVEMSAKTPVKGSGEAETPVETPVEAETPVKTPVETPVRTPDQILQVLRREPHKALVEVAKELGRSQRAVERAAAKLIREGRLRYLGPRKSGVWEVLE